MAEAAEPAAPGAPTATPTPRPMPRWAELVTVGVGGALGTLTRAAASHAWPAPAGGLPVTTLAVNLIGALLLGLLLGHLALAGPDAGARKVARLGIGTGFMGGLTTYSTFMVESERLLTGGHAALGLAYLLGSILAGLLAASAGLTIAARAHGGGRA
ncbi:fluoride efflux transporter FluC [Actinomyces radicidentis]|uniref:fluoride efflux transporter FluC n=1 Tax=Actinomyces radicidentis TaxID=111015 RepID=UPI000AEE00E4|nr:CrcB family protein [Actinomyces radicidentis]